MIAEIKIKIERFVPQFSTPSRSNSADPCAGVCRCPIHSGGTGCLSGEQPGPQSRPYPLLLGSGCEAHWLPCQPLEGLCCDPVRLPLRASGFFFNPSSLNFPCSDDNPSAQAGCGAPTRCQQRTSWDALVSWGGEGGGQASLLVVLGGACRGAGPGASCPGRVPLWRWGPSRPSLFSCFKKIRYSYIVFKLHK